MEASAMEDALRAALVHDQFRVHYQPLVGFAQSEVVGFEALLRWEHPRHGVVGPDAFLAAAESSGLVVAIGAWVLHAACVEAARWKLESTYDPPLTVTVNVSAREFAAPALVDTVRHALSASGLDPHLLAIEVCEPILAADPDRAGAVLGELAALGVRVSIDHFGSHPASPQYLDGLPVHALKLDRSVVDGLGRDEHDAEVVGAAVQLGHGRGLAVGAEGIETPRQLSEARSLGCDLGQGFYFARPQPADVVRALVHRRFRWREHSAA